MKAVSVTTVCTVALLLGACGFHPLYASGPRGAAGDMFASIYVEPITDPGVANTGYDLRNTLIDLLDSNQGRPAYRLKLTLKETSQWSALTNNSEITRYNDTLTVNYQLTSTATDKVLASGVETGLAAYNVITSPYATLAAQQDADKRVAEDIAERLRIRLGVYFRNRANSGL